MSQKHRRASGPASTAPLSCTVLRGTGKLPVLSGQLRRGGGGGSLRGKAARFRQYAGPRAWSRACDTDMSLANAPSSPRTTKSGVGTRNFARCTILGQWRNDQNGTGGGTVMEILQFAEGSVGGAVHTSDVCDFGLSKTIEAPQLTPTEAISAPDLARQLSKQISGAGLLAAPRAMRQHLSM